MGAVEKPVFSFGELLVLLDVEGAGALSAPVPTPNEAAVLVGNGLQGAGACVEVHGTCRFRTGLAHLYDPPRTELVVSPAHVMLSITRFADEDIWKNMFEWVSGYLADTLTPTERTAGREGYLEYAGQGVFATLSYRRPSVRLDSRDAVIELALRRDEPTLATLRRLLGLAEDAAIATSDASWRGLATRWPLHLEVSRHGETARFRFSAPHQDGQTSTANLCEAWCGSWLDLCAGTGLSHAETQVSWDLGSLGRASMVHGHDVHHRDVHELHVPVRWLAS